MQNIQLQKSYGIDELPVKNRTSFIRLLMDDEQTMRRLGIKKVKKVLNFYKAEILHYNDEIKINFEFSTEDYAQKKFNFGNLDLLVTFVRDDFQIVRGVPVWSFYRKVGQMYIATLDEDIVTDFDMLGENYVRV